MTDMHPRVVAFGGFLAAGKTTSLLALARRLKADGKSVGIVTNDQAGRLVDTEIFRASGFNAAEVAGGCFCCRFDDFIARADELIERVNPAVILAEPVGSCTDIVGTVLNPLKQLYPGRFTIAPYVVLVDPLRALKVLGRTGPVSLSERVTYIYRMQQQEADAIAIAKVDLLSPQDRDRVEALVREQFPGRRVLSFSALTGEGLDELVAYLATNSGGGKALENLDYDIYAAGEAELGWLNCSVRLQSPGVRDVDAVLTELGSGILEGCRQRNLEIAHGKLLIKSDGQVAVLNMTDTAAEPVLSRTSGASAAEMNLTINLRIQASPGELDKIVQIALSHWANQSGGTVTAKAAQAFSPPRPVPTHRIPESSAQV